MLKKQLWLSFLICLLAYAPLHARAEYSMAEAINEAGRQRMLTQRILKAYAQIGLGIQREDSRKELRYSIELFDSQLERLKGLPLDDRTRSVLRGVEFEWQPYKAMAQSGVTREKALRMLALSDELLHRSHRFVLALQDQAETEAAVAINVSGRQRMLSQRLAKFYLLTSWGVQTVSMRSEADSARSEFEGALKQLRLLPVHTGEIQQQLDSIELEWQWFRSALDQSDDERFDLVVLGASDKLLESLEMLTALYEMQAST